MPALGPRPPPAAAARPPGQNRRAGCSSWRGWRLVRPLEQRRRRRGSAQGRQRRSWAAEAARRGQAAGADVPLAEEEAQPPAMRWEQELGLDCGGWVAAAQLGISALLDYGANRVLTGMYSGGGGGGGGGTHFSAHSSGESQSHHTLCVLVNRKA